MPTISPPLLLGPLFVVATLALPPTSLLGQVPASAKLPPGSYFVMMEESDPVPPQAVGRWDLELDSLTFRIIRGTEVLVHGEYQLKGDTLLVTDRGGELSCESTGRYLWSIILEGLQFVEIDDRCPPRAIVLSTHPFQKKRSP
jgi:hypothetical protein